MDIRVGELYVNKTLVYLLPCLYDYGETFKVKLNSIFNLGFGIHDAYMDGTPYEKQRLFYILCDKLYQPAKFMNFLNYLKSKEYYVKDYPYDDLENGRKHMIAIKFPEARNDAYDKFVIGKYSEMYNSDDIHQFFGNSDILDILTKSKKRVPDFVIFLNNKYGTTLTEKDVIEESMELDLPYKKEEEIFNYKVSKV